MGRRLLVTTDHEGGRIIMLNRGVTIFPDGLAAGTSGETRTSWSGRASSRAASSGGSAWT